MCSALFTWVTRRSDQQRFCRAMLCKRVLMLSCSVSVCLSVTFVHSVEMNKHIFIFSPSGSHTIPIFFRTKRHGNIPTATLLTGGVECRWGRQKSRFWASIWLHCELFTLRLARCCQYDAGGPPYARKLWHLLLVASGGVDSGRRRRNVHDNLTKSVNVTPKTTERRVVFYC